MNGPLSEDYVLGAVGDWGSWTTCTQPCGEYGTQERTRTCAVTPCTESLKETQRCNVKVCPSKCLYYCSTFIVPTEDLKRQTLRYVQIPG